VPLKLPEAGDKDKCGLAAKTGRTELKTSKTKIVGRSFFIGLDLKSKVLLYLKYPADQFGKQD